jgi:hypothetical protein
MKGVRRRVVGALKKSVAPLLACSLIAGISLTVFASEHIANTMLWHSQCFMQSMIFSAILQAPSMAGFEECRRMTHSPCGSTYLEIG